MGDITDDLWLMTGGSAVSIATDEMLADIATLRAISAHLGTISTKLAAAEAMLTAATQGMAQVSFARLAMDDAWIAKNEAQGICDYVADSMTTAIDNYTETELNAQWLALGVDSVLAFFAGRQVDAYLDMLGPLAPAIAVLLPWFVRGKFDGGTTPIGASDVKVDSGWNAFLADPDTVAALRRFVMTGEFFAAGLGEVPAAAAAVLSTLTSGVEISGNLLLMYAAFAGMLTETGVTVSKTSSYERPWAPTTSTESRFENVPSKRGDDAQIRIDEIHDGDAVRYEVFVGGTADFNPISKGEPFDLTSNVAGVAGHSPASYRAVQLAMEQAGISATDQVAFVGYSQGGLIATMLAASGEYNTQGLTTFAAPAGQIVVPAGIPALIIEHFEDPVTALGGTQLNGTQANSDAVVVQRHAFSDEKPADLTLPVPGHQAQYYSETARLIDEADSAVLQATVDELNAFSAGDSVTSTFYYAERVP